MTRIVPIFFATFFSCLFSNSAISAAQNEIFTNVDIFKDGVIEVKRGMGAKIISNDGEATYMEISAAEPSPVCELLLKTRIKPLRTTMISFEYKTVFCKKSSQERVWVIIRDDRGNSFKTSISSCSNWRTAILPLSDFKNSDGQTINFNNMLSEVSILTTFENGSDSTRKLYLKDILIDNAADSPKVERVSYSACPLFSWPQSKGNDYCLEYSQNPEFPANETRRINTSENFHVASEFLQDGIWYWRVKLKDEAGVFSRGKLTIPKLTHKFRTPQFSFQQLANSSYPRLRRLAELIAKEDGMLESTAKKALPSGIPPDFPPFKGTRTPVRSKDWPDWYAKKYGLLMREVAPGLSSVGQAAEAFDDMALKNKAKKLLLEIIRKWDPEKVSSIEEGDLEAGAILQGMCWCFDAAYNIMNDDERKMAIDAISIRSRQFFNFINPPFRLYEDQNHSWSMGTSLAFPAIVCAGHSKEAEQWFEFPLALYAYRFLPSMGFDGDNNEGMAYWTFGNSFIMKYADLMREICGIDLYKHPWLTKTARFPVYCAPPNSFMVSFADYTQNGLPNHGNKGPVSRKLVGNLGRRTEDSYALWYGGVPCFKTIKAKAPVDIPQSMHYRYIGWAVFNTCLTDSRENVALGFHSGKFLAAHQHGDQNSFVINAYGDKLAVDGGYYDWYDSPHFNDYSTQTKAHNTILVDGQGQAVRRFGADGKISEYYDSSSWGYTEGDASNPRIYGGGVLTEFKRKMIFMKPSFIISYDSILSRKPAVFSWLLHAQSDSPIKIEQQPETFQINRPLAWLRGKVIFPEKAGMKISSGYDVLPYMPLSSKPMKMEDIEKEWTLNIYNRQKEKSVEYLVGFQVGKSDDNQNKYADFVGLENKFGLGVIVSQPDSYNYVVIYNRNPGQKMEPLYNLATDGNIAAIKFGEGEKIIDALLIGGTFLSYKDKDIYRSDSVGNWSMIKPEQVLVQHENNKIVRINGESIPCDVYKSRQADGKYLTVITGIMKVEKQTSYNVSSACSSLNYRICNPDAEFTGNVGKSKPHESILLPAGEYLITFTSIYSIDNISMDS